MDRAEQVRQILSTRGLTLYRVSQQSAELFGRSSQFFVPHNWYSGLADPSLIPTIHQMFALSHISNYRLTDWLTVFGFDLDRIARLRLLIPRQATTLLDSSVYDLHTWIPWLADRPRAGPVLPIAPLGQFLAPAGPRRAVALLGLNKRSFLYAKVGGGDVYAFPHLAPGSIVRVDERRSGELLAEEKNNSAPRLFLVEHGAGFACTQLLRLGKDRILLHSPERPCAQVELRLGREVRILGVVDAEIRPLRGNPCAAMVRRPASLAKPRTLNAQAGLQALLKSSRWRLGITFREASAMSRWIAGTLEDQLYFAAPSTLSDYETLSAPPRHLQKILTLCVLYSIDFQEFLRACGLSPEQDGREPIPDELVPRQPPDCRHDMHIPMRQENGPEQGRFLDFLLEQWNEIPLFLRPALNELTGLRRFSLQDVFWVGGDQAPIHPLLNNATFVVVNRRIRRPAAPKPECPSPLCLLLLRDGSYLCGCCALHRGNLLVRAYPNGRLETRKFRDGADAEAIGQVTTILRKLP